MKVRISTLAAFKIEKLLDFIESEWSTQSRNRFANKLKSKIALLKSKPFAFPKSNIRDGLRKLVLSKQNTILYKVDNNTIYILTIFDNRQDPRKLRDEIKRLL